MLLQSKGFTVKQMADIFKCSTSLVNRHLQAMGNQQRKKYSNIDDATLDMVVTRLHRDYPNAGIKVCNTCTNVHQICSIIPKCKLCSLKFPLAMKKIYDNKIFTEFCTVSSISIHMFLFNL